MSNPSGRFVVIAAAALALVVGATVAFLVSRPNGGGPEAPPAVFLSRDGDTFTLAGKPFYAAGSNNYRPAFVDDEVTDLIMKTAADNNFRIMRVWGFNDIGNSDGSDSVDSQNVARYFHYWDGAKPAYNDGENGLQRLDAVIASAKKYDIRLVIPFVNNWAAYGGVDQYVRWAKGKYHSDFYTDATIKKWYQDWVAHLLDRVNTRTGVKYKDEPTIAIWELINEGRCAGGGQYPPAPDCKTDTITNWTREMAAYVKSVDNNHLLGFGDEGFMCEQGADHWTRDCSIGTDPKAVAAIPEIDMVGMHLYPDHWKRTVEWSTQFIKDHQAIANEVKKPLFIGEYGWRGQAPRSAVFNEWLTAFQEGGGDIALYWIMQPGGGAALDWDGFTAYCPSPVCRQVNFRSQAMATGKTDFPPIAEVNVVKTAPGRPATIEMLPSAVSLFSTIDPASLDLDPATAGVQNTVTVPAGTLTVAGTKLTYTPAKDFTGSVQVPYTLSDVQGRTSEPAAVQIIVSTSIKPSS